MPKGHGDPGTFFHPSLYYYVTAAAYVGVFGTLKILGTVPASQSMTDLFLADERYFVFTARSVSVVAAVLAIYAVYRLASSICDRRAGLFAAALLAVLPLHAIYSRTVRVDSLFVLLFVCACGCLVRLMRNPEPTSYTRAGLAIGLATSANYNGGSLLLSLIGAHLFRAAMEYAHNGTKDLIRALGWAVAGFLLSSPFVLFNIGTFLQGFGFISSLALSAHPGWEGRGLFHYVDWLAQSEPLLAVLLAATSLTIGLLGNRVERFVLSIPWCYVLIFSLIPSKDERFIQPAIVLFLVAAGTLPGCLARRLRSRPYVCIASNVCSYSLLLACIGVMAQRSIPFSPQHEMLDPPDTTVFNWIEANVRPQSNILVESGVVLLIDTLKEPGAFAAELRKSLVARRPNLDQNFQGLVYVGGRNYDAAILMERHIDYVLISKRHVDYIEAHCDLYPEACAFYRELWDNADVAFEPAGTEPVVMYKVRRS